MLMMLIIILCSVAKFNNPRFAYNAYTHYNNQITEGYDNVVNLDSFEKWNKQFISRMLYYERERGVNVNPSDL